MVKKVLTVLNNHPRVPASVLSRWWHRAVSSLTDLAAD